MKCRAFISLILCGVLLLNPVFAFETDQYNLPETPLGDIGPEVTVYTESAIRRAIEKINAEIDEREACLEADSKGCGSAKKTRKKLAELRSEDAIAKFVFNRLGAGMIPFTKAGWWMDTHEFKAQPARYRSGYTKSVHITAPFNYITISPTIRMYEQEFGTDKIAHLFQQGFDYYLKYRKAKRKGATEQEALNKAVKWGRMTEKTYFGTWVSAIYSNADLAANYAGLKFYQGLSNEVEIGDHVRPPILVLKDGKWAFNENIETKDELLKPLISQHFNEAYNPNKIFNIAGFRNVFRGMVKKRVCRQWFKRYPDLSKSGLETTQHSLEDWHGEYYGFSRSKNFVTIANTCFNEDGTARVQIEPVQESDLKTTKRTS